VAPHMGVQDADRQEFRHGRGMSQFGSILVEMTRFEDEDLTDSEFRECDLTRA